MNRELDSFCKDLYQHFKGRTCFVACSGGMDSMLLLHLLRTANLSPIALHVNYQLRGVDSDLDQKCVEDYCKEHNLICFTKRIDLSKSTENIQLLARKERYLFFDSVRAEHPNSLVCIGHHQDDQVETFFLQLARGAGMKGLAGMQEKTSDYCRPLLTKSREVLKGWALSEKLIWREDLSNQQSKYARNKLRNIVLPFLEENIQDIKESVLLLQNVFRENHFFLEKQLQIKSNSLLNGEPLSSHSVESFSNQEWAEFLRQVGIRFSLLPEVKKLFAARVGAKLKISENRNLLKVNNGIIMSELNFISPVYKLSISPADFLPNQFSLDEVYLDPNKIVGEIRISSWNNGDLIYPVGMLGKSYVSHVIKDAKVPLEQRKNKVVVRDDNYIHWIPGVKVGRMALATTSSEKIRIRLIIENNSSD